MNLSSFAFSFSSSSVPKRSESQQKVKAFSSKHMGLLQNTLCMTIKRVFSVVLLDHFLLVLSCWELSIPLKYQQIMVKSHGTCNNGDEDEMHHSAAYISSNIITRYTSKLTSYCL